MLDAPITHTAWMPGAIRSFTHNLLWLAFLIGLSATASADTVSLGLVTGSTASDGEVQVLESLLKSELGELRGYQMIQAHSEPQADLIIGASLTRLGASYIVVIDAELRNGDIRSRTRRIRQVCKYRNGDY